MRPKRLKPPEHLMPTTRAWWRDVAENYVLEPHHMKLLQLAGESWDRGQQARELLLKDGITFRDDRGNVRAHPAVAIEKDARIGYARLIRELDLDVEAPRSERIGPSPLRSNRG
jgi:P27 family predicted phage terminase small subunit